MQGLKCVVNCVLGDPKRKFRIFTQHFLPFTWYPHIFWQFHPHQMNFFLLQFVLDRQKELCNSEEEAKFYTHNLTIIAQSNSLQYKQNSAWKTCHHCSPIEGSMSWIEGQQGDTLVSLFTSFYVSRPFPCDWRTNIYRNLIPTDFHTWWHIWVKRTRMDIMQNSITFFPTSKPKYTN